MKGKLTRQNDMLNREYHNQVPDEAIFPKGNMDRHSANVLSGKYMQETMPAQQLLPSFSQQY